LNMAASGALQSNFRGAAGTADTCQRSLGRRRPSVAIGTDKGPHHIQQEEQDKTRRSDQAHRGSGVAMAESSCDQCKDSETDSPAHDHSSSLTCRSGVRAANTVEVEGTSLYAARDMPARAPSQSRLAVILKTFLGKTDKKHLGVLSAIQAEPGRPLKTGCDPNSESAQPQGTLCPVGCTAY